MIDALGPFEWALRWVSLDQAGARMSACFQFKRSYEIDPNDSLKAQITLVNSYNTATALGLHLGFFREIHGSTMLDTNDFRSRWVHAGNEAESAAFGKAIEAALRDFEQRGLPHYRKMAAHTLDQSQALRAVILAIKKDILPQKLAEAALRCVFTDTNHSAWSVFNALARALTSFQGTPTRLMEIQQKIARNFKDGGVHLLGGIGDISQQELDSWNRGAA
jgi:hypothetical protein